MNALGGAVDERRHAMAERRFTHNPGTGRVDILVHLVGEVDLTEDRRHVVDL